MKGERGGKEREEGKEGYCPFLAQHSEEYW